MAMVLSGSGGLCEDCGFSFVVEKVPGHGLMVYHTGAQDDQAQYGPVEKFKVCPYAGKWFSLPVLHGDMSMMGVGHPGEPVAASGLGGERRGGSRSPINWEETGWGKKIRAAAPPHSEATVALIISRLVETVNLRLRGVTLTAVQADTLSCSLIREIHLVTPPAIHLRCDLPESLAGASDTAVSRIEDATEKVLARYPAASGGLSKPIAFEPLTVDETQGSDVEDLSWRTK